jgi:signal transduction histidine kinase
MTTVHEIAARLRPGILDDLGLLATLEWQIENFQKRTGLTCIAELPDIEVEIAPDVATVIFRCAQTLLTNISLHARVRRVWFRFAYDTHGMTLVVTDDGIGITEDAIDSPRSFGLIGIRERIRPLDGVFTIHPFQPSGTEARITIPHTNARSHHD